MFEFVLEAGNRPFAIALGLMLGIAVLEGTMTLLGAGLSDAIDSMLPDLDGDADVDIGPDISDVNGSGADFGDASIDHVEVGSPNALSRLLGWLCVGKVPVLILLVAFLTMFGLTGLIVQSMVQGFLGFLLPSSLASIPAVIVAVPSVRFIGNGLSKLIPKDESTAVASDTFIGRVATITIGTARKGEPAEAKLTDRHGQTHYVMVEPDSAGETFETGTDVLLIEQDGPRFVAVRNTNAALTDN
ncbi:MAG: DUF1449 family protein [Alphaproteobacteria bacterium]|nr:DUF1449 family protein [Alphaproteobacteria bacterium]